MKLDFKKIINIKNKKDLNNFKLDKPIYLSNYLFHYLIIFNKLNILKLQKFPIYKENEEGYNGFFLAAKNNNLPILKYLIKEYPDYIYNTDSNDDLFINLLKINNIIKLINLKLDFKKLLFYRLTEENTSEKIIDILLYNCNYKELTKLFKYFKFSDHPLNFLIINEKLLDNQIISLLKNFTKEQFNLRDPKDFNLLFTAITRESEVLVKYFIDNNVLADYYTFIKTFHPLRTAFLNKNKNIYSLIWSFIKKTYDFNSANKELDNIAHFLLSNNAIDKTSIEILSSCPSSVWHQLNKNKISPLELLTKYDFNKYKMLIINKEVDLKINNIIEKIKNKDWLKLFLSLKKYKIENNIIFENYKYAHGNLFQAKFKDLAMIVIYLKDKYKNIFIPNLDDYALKNLNYSDGLGIDWPDGLFERMPIFPWIICYDNESNYWIHNNLNNVINSKKKDIDCDFSFCYLSLTVPDIGLHANILIYDFKNMTIERFDPYGDTVVFDKYLDDILEEELTWNTGFKYLKPSDYLPVASFQTVSDELNPLNLKAGDYGGFCLAWCTWYLEHRIKNKNINGKILVDKLIKKLVTLDISFADYIRNYANKLNEGRILHYEQAGLDEKEISNIVTDQFNNRLINKYIVKQLAGIN